MIAVTYLRLSDETDRPGMLRFEGEVRLTNPLVDEWRSNPETLARLATVDDGPDAWICALADAIRARDGRSGTFTPRPTVRDMGDADVVEARALPAPGHTVRLGWTRCKAAGGGAPCVNHCGDIVCLEIQP